MCHNSMTHVYKTMTCHKPPPSLLTVLHHIMTTSLPPSLITPTTLYIHLYIPSILDSTPPIFTNTIATTTKVKVKINIKYTITIAITYTNLVTIIIIITFTITITISINKTF